MTALVIDISRVRRAVRNAPIHRETREQAVERTLRKITAEASDQQAHAANMATRDYTARLHRLVSVYIGPGAPEGKP